MTETKATIQDLIKELTSVNFHYELEVTTMLEGLREELFSAQMGEHRGFNADAPRALGDWMGKVADALCTLKTQNTHLYLSPDNDVLVAIPYGMVSDNRHLLESNSILYGESPTGYYAYTMYNYFDGDSPFQDRIIVERQGWRFLV